MSGHLVIAGPASGQGKTSVALGLTAALRARGVRVSVCKVGPDYLDTGWHSLAAGRPARNLDLWTMGAQGVAAAFSRAAADADAVLIEGVMGLFDGHRTGAAPTSTADVAALLGAPVLLVLDAAHSAASLAAVAHGLATFDERVRVGGAVLNRFGAHRERSAIDAAFESAGLPVLGWLPRSEAAELSSRHLGLVQSAEDEERSLAAIAALGALVEEYVDVDVVLDLARSAGPVPATKLLRPAEQDSVAGGDACAPPVRIAVAQDSAFTFRYADNVETLTGFGAEVVWFSPLQDEDLPAGTCGIYLCGGYPELHAAELAANSAMRARIAAAADAGVPIYAECGGMLYLFETLVTREGDAYPMTGVFPARGVMGERLSRVGYVEAELAGDGILGSAGTLVRGHEFRYSACEPQSGDRPAWIVDGQPQGFSAESVVASYLHLNFAGCPEVARAFVSSCQEWRSKMEDTL